MIYPVPGASRRFTLTDRLQGEEHPGDFTPRLPDRGTMIPAFARNAALVLFCASMTPVTVPAQARPPLQASRAPEDAVAGPQAFPVGRAEKSSTGQSSFESVCHERSADRAAIAALRLVCQRPIAHGAPAPGEAIVIGFLGGFAKADDLKHPEVLFAEYLREHYSPALHARVFSNHDEQGALQYVTRLLDQDHDGRLSAEEIRTARIIIYGHSWGASQTAAFARDLGRRGIPVLLTVQLDIITKHGQKPSVIPSNVASAINFYQSEGPLQGRPKIVAADPARTTIIGNFKMAYSDAPVNCDNFPWFVRTFNKPHHEIENDAHLWDRITSLIDAKIAADDHTRKGAARDIAPSSGEMSF